MKVTKYLLPVLLVLSIVLGVVDMYEYRQTGELKDYVSSEFNMVWAMLILIYMKVEK